MGPQMDVLRRSIEQLVTPICRGCNVEMAWSRSTLVAAEQLVSHIFICPRCSGVDETKAPVTTAKK
jgi:hypothetical protein